MLAPSVFASAHYLALALGLGGVFIRGRSIRRIELNPKDAGALKSLFASDSCWGLAALLWLLTGLTRAFGGLEKGSDFYIHHPLFWVKMSMFGLAGIMEIVPMITFIRWRIASKKGVALPGVESPGRLRVIRVINDVQVLLVLLIPFVASAMARGIGL